MSCNRRLWSSWCRCIRWFRHMSRPERDYQGQAEASWEVLARCNFLRVVDFRRVSTVSCQMRFYGPHQPSPQNFEDRPQSPSAEQQEPQVGVQTQPVVPPQVPSSVSTPVAQAGCAVVVADWHHASAGSKARMRWYFIAMFSRAVHLGSVGWNKETGL